jgi:hypothetical protein
MSHIIKQTPAALSQDISMKMYSLSTIPVTIKLRRVRRQRHVARIGTLRNTYKILVGKSEGKRPLARWITKMDLTEIGCN